MAVMKKMHTYLNIAPARNRRFIDIVIPFEDRKVSDLCMSEYKDITGDEKKIKLDTRDHRNYLATIEVNTGVTEE